MSNEDDHNSGENAKPNEPDPSKKEEKSEADKPKKKPFWKRPLLLGSMIGVVVLLVIGGVIWWLATRNYESTDDAFIDGRMVHVAPRISGKVVSLEVEDNQYVEAGTVLIRIDKAPFRAAYENTKAMLLQAMAKVEQSDADFSVQQANAEQAKADVLVAQANAQNAAADYLRYKSLEPGARSQQQLDTAEANAKSTAAQLTAAQKKAASADAQVQSAKTSIDASKAQVAAAQAQVDQAALNLQYSEVTAGQAGFVTRRTVEKGNYVQTGQEIMVVIPTDVWVTANFKETQLTFMRPGQPVEVEVDAFPGHTYRAHVQSIQTGTGAVFSLLPPENATGNYVKIVQRVPVKIVFDEKLDRVLAPGESVSPKVDIRTGRNGN